MNPDDIDSISSTLRGGSDDARAEVLAALDARGEPVPASLEDLLATTYFDDVTVAAWSGVLLLRRPDLDDAARARLLVRVLPGLVDQVDDAAAEAFIRAFGAVSPRVVYDLAGDMVGLDDGSDIERRYAYGVLTAFDWQRLTDDARSMAGR